MKIFQILICFSFTIISLDGFSQFKTAFDIQDKNIKVVYFRADQVSEIQMQTYNQNHIQLQSKSEGSYKSELYFNYQISQDSLIINSVYPKPLEYGHNKMTSTQVFSVNVNLSLPDNVRLIIDSSLTSFYGRGRLTYLQINTKSGHCYFEGFLNKASINTYNGSVNLNIQDAKVEGNSQNGSVEIFDFIDQLNEIVVKTVNGDIKVTQIE